MPTYQIPLDVLELSTRTYNILRRVGIEFLDQILAYREEDLLQLRGIGPLTIDEIRRKQKEFDQKKVLQEYPEPHKCTTRRVVPSANKSILFCDVSKRTANALVRAGIRTLDDLVKLDREELLKIRGIGELALEEIDEILNGINIETIAIMNIDQAEGFLGLISEDAREKAQNLLERHGITEYPKELSWRSLLCLGLRWETIEALERSLIELGATPLEKITEDCIIGHEVLEYLLRIGCPLSQIAAGRASALDRIRATLHSAGIKSLLDACLLHEVQIDDLLGDESIRYREELDWYLQQLPSLDWDTEVSAFPPNPVIVWRLKQTTIARLWVDVLTDLGISGRNLDIFMARTSAIGSEMPTLEELGKRFKITRERVRQIEVRGKRCAREALRTNEMIQVLLLLAKRIINEQGLINRRELAESMIDIYELQEEGYEDVLLQILFIADDVKYEKKLESFVSSEIPKRLLLKLHSYLIEKLHKAKAPILTEDLKKSLDGLLSEDEKEINDQFQVWKKVLEASGDFEQVEEKYWGLTKWDNRVLDEVVMALREAGKPTHFREITKLANKRLSKDQQTTFRATHAKLAHHHDLFMRTGPGTFGLREWDPDKPLQPTKYRTLIKQVLEKAGEPLLIDEIYKRVNALRPIKTSTVTMYLQLHDDFIAQEDGYYSLAAWSDTQEKSHGDKLPDDLRKSLQERAKRVFAKREGVADR